MVPALVDFQPLASAQRDRYGVSGADLNSTTKADETKAFRMGRLGVATAEVHTQSSSLILYARFFPQGQSSPHN
jgi:hypothetical protein